MKFGEVYRRHFDDLIVMFIGVAAGYIKLDEMGVQHGALIAITLDRGTCESLECWPLLGECWPLLGTALANDLKDHPDEWTLLDE